MEKQIYIGKFMPFKREDLDSEGRKKDRNKKKSLVIQFVRNLIKFS
jgi:hypothetical protein